MYIALADCYLIEFHAAIDLVLLQEHLSTSSGTQNEIILSIDASIAFAKTVEFLFHGTPRIGWHNQM